jgi:hypothetical protein
VSSSLVAVNRQVGTRTRSPTNTADSDLGDVNARHWNAPGTHKDNRGAASEVGVADGVELELELAVMAALVLALAVCTARQLLFPGATVRMSVLPPLPAPAVSPATTRSRVPFWNAGVHANDILLGEPDKTREDAPPGMTTNTSTGGCAAML